MHQGMKPLALILLGVPKVGTLSMKVVVLEHSFVLTSVAPLVYPDSVLFPILIISPKLGFVLELLYALALLFVIFPLPNIYISIRRVVRSLTIRPVVPKFPLVTLPVAINKPSISFVDVRTKPSLVVAIVGVYLFALSFSFLVLNKTFVDRPVSKLED